MAYKGFAMLTQKEREIATKMQNLKNASGSHSPSIFTIAKEIPQIHIDIDACFLSNPYATNLFMDYMQRDLIRSNKLRDILEFYPSQNAIIAQYLSQSLGIESHCIFVANGAIEAIQAILHNFVKGKIIVNIPTFSSYYEFVTPQTQVIYYDLPKENDYKLCVKSYIDFVKKHKPQTVIIINPNNPNGDYLPLDFMREILRNLAEIENIIIDESFLHFAFESDDFAPISYAPLFREFNNVILLKSMSKDFGIAGIRAGYAIMNRHKVDSLLKNGYLWNSNGLSEYFFSIYGKQDFRDKYEIVRKKYIAQTQEFFSDLAKIDGLKVYPSKANFALLELVNGVRANDFVIKMLLRYGIYTRTCNDKIGLNGEFVRLASRTKEENNIILDALKDLFGEKDEQKHSSHF